MGKKISELSTQELKEKSIYDLYKGTELPEEIIKELVKEDEEVGLTKEELKKLKDPLQDPNKEQEKTKDMLKEAYRNIVSILREYIDMRDDYYNIIALWIMGTYFHSKFPTVFSTAFKISHDLTSSFIFV